MSDVLLSVQDLSVAYPLGSESEASPTWAIEGLSLTVGRGECVGLVGESGCGKSTLGRTLMHLLPKGSRVEGRCTLNQRDIRHLSGSALTQFRGEEIAYIFQDPMTRLNPLMTIKQHCLETLKVHQPALSHGAAQKKVLDTLKAVNIPGDRWTQYPHEFSGGMRQRVAIALALLLGPKLMIADEPTTSLDVTVSAQILQELTRLCRDREMGLLLISHDLALVSEYCDRVAVMYQGQMVELGKADQILTRPQHPYTQSLLQSALHLQTETAEAFDPSHPPGEENILLRLTQLEQYYVQEANLLARLFAGKDSIIRPVDKIDLTLRNGETLGLVGESGCGKSTLSRTILQLARPKSGSVQFKGVELTDLRGQRLREMRRQIQMIFQDPRACLNPMMKIGTSIAEPLLIHRLQSWDQAIIEAKKLMERVGLTPAEDYVHRLPSDLSGGQLQRVAIARALITQPQLIICDEPVSMLDASIQSQVLDLMQSLKVERQLTYIFITHDLWVARFFCDRIAVMHQGKIVEIGPTAEIFKTPQHPYTQSLIQAAPLLARLS
ncbi:dipeptide ABC transporter ATP-binding protein [Lyngbya confervoides]|uniref:ABC transporter ATP-binding protein n=1 Tax=Lyngbya confervoides BDU141951 TaxID=1574623 RepID=A0ABD4T8V6_9CYAN|nr:ABC transporter ATP-binding protein [Lyngbya confervoides]MCM1984997.1 ABC transporter ATP-binding protein [Lyngbya confervoides BDU141951]